MRVRVAAVGELSDRTTRTFPFARRGEPLQGFVASHGGRLVAYVNRCRHVPWPLDRGDGVIYDRAREHFLCRTHGAVYEPASGLCILGPCAGDFLEELTVVIEGDDVLVEIGDGEEE